MEIHLSCFDHANPENSQLYLKLSTKNTQEKTAASKDFKQLCKIT